MPTWWVKAMKEIKDADVCAGLDSPYFVHLLRQLHEIFPNFMKCFMELKRVLQRFYSTFHGFHGVEAINHYIRARTHGYMCLFFPRVLVYKDNSMKYMKCQVKTGYYAFQLYEIGMKTI